jgi:hypothetical protein
LLNRKWFAARGQTFGDRIQIGAKRPQIMHIGVC